MISKNINIMFKKIGALKIKVVQKVVRNVTNDRK